MTALDDKAMERYHGLCVMCLERADCVHHEPPLSLESEKEENLYPLCGECHDDIHDHRANAKERCEAGAQFTLAYLNG